MQDLVAEEYAEVGCTEAECAEDVQEECVEEECAAVEGGQEECVVECAVAGVAGNNFYKKILFASVCFGCCSKSSVSKGSRIEALHKH